MSKLNCIRKNEDPHYIRSSEALKNIVERKIKSTYVGALKCIEIKFGTNFEGYEQIRREILRIGNDAIRDISSTIDSSFNIEQIPEVLTIKFIDKGKEF